MISRTQAILTALLITFSASLAIGDSGSVESAIERLDAAISDSYTTPDQEVLQAAAVLNDAFDQEGVSTSGSELALGNAYLIGGDTGRAVLHYHRGLAIDPGDEVLRSNLERARAAVDPIIPDTDRTRIAQRVTHVIGSVFSRERLWWIGACSLGLLSGLLSLRLLGYTTIARGWVLAAMLIIAVLSWLAIGIHSYSDRTTKRAVLLDHGVIARAGPGEEAYDSVYDAALGAGTEAVLLEERRGWSNLRLLNGDEIWVPAYSIELVNPEL